MRQVQIALLSAILVALSVIAFELHSIRAFLVPVARAGVAVDYLLTEHPETRAERNARLQRETRESIEDMKAILETNTTTQHGNPKHTPADHPAPPQR